MGVGDSSYKVITPKPNPDVAGNITGVVNVNPGQNNLLYTVSPIANASKYLWTLPDGYNGSSDSNSILINIGSNAQSGIIKVKGSNDCNYGQESSINITVNNGMWQNTNLIPFDPNNPDNIIISKSASNILVWDYNYSQLYLSTNSGEEWHSINHLGQDCVSEAMIDSIIYIVVNNNISTNIYQSTDLGINWTLLNNGIDTLNYTRLLGGEGKIMASNNYQLYLLNKNDTIWKNITNGLPSNSNINPLAIDGNNLYVITNNDQFYKSSDNGLTWILINTGLTNVYINSLAINGGKLYIGTNIGVYLSIDGGINWNPLNNGLTNLSISTIAIYNNKLFIGSYTGVNMSIDNGNTWFPINDGLNSLDIYKLTVVDSNIFAVTYDGLWKRKLSGFAFIQGNDNNIQGLTSVCKNQQNVIYSINPIPNANSYTWILPNGYNGSSTTNSISINFDTNAVSGSITVKKTGDSIYYTLAITVNKIPIIDTTYNNVFNSGTSVIGNTVNSIAINSQNNVWYGCYYGLYQELSNYQPSNYSTYINNMNDRRINTIIFDNNNNLWLGTPNGLLEFTDNYSLTYNITNSGLAGNYITSLFFENTNVLWMGTNNGFSKFDGINFTNYLIPGGVNNTVYTIAKDLQNNLWIGTDYGLIKYDGINYTTYTKNNSSLSDNKINDIKIDYQNRI